MKILTAVLLALAVMLSGCTEDKVPMPLPQKVLPKPEYSSDRVGNIQAKLKATKELVYTKVHVMKEGENIVLVGSVYTKKQKFLASSVARSVQGSGRVINRLVLP
jgi:osmotically-inducible protein OsmY